MNDHALWHDLVTCENSRALFKPEGLPTLPAVQRTQVPCGCELQDGHAP